jgi:hypothetical protein
LLLYCFCPSASTHTKVGPPPSNLPSRLSRLAAEPKHTRISCHAALDIAADAAFRKKRHMKLANATNLDRKSESSLADLQLALVEKRNREAILASLVRTSGGAWAAVIFKIRYF